MKAGRPGLGSSGVVMIVATAVAVLLAIGGVLAVVSAPLSSTGAKQLTAGRHTAFLTFYGWWDNTPPGGAIAFPGLHRTAGGTGSYADPITLATSSAELRPGSRVYVPRVGKYFIVEDSCQECGVDYRGQGRDHTKPGPNGGPGLVHFDLWLGGRGGNAFDAIDCEDALTRYDDSGPVLEPVVIDPGPGERVSTQPLFDATTGRCFGGAKADSTTGTYANRASGNCLTAAGTTVGSPLSTAPCSADDDQSLVFNGAFLMAHGLCAQIGSDTATSIVLEHCDGGPLQQWSVNTDGTITDIQTGQYAISDAGGRVIARRFGAGPGARDEWTFHAGQ